MDFEGLGSEDWVANEEVVCLFLGPNGALEMVPDSRGRAKVDLAPGVGLWRELAAVVRRCGG